MTKKLFKIIAISGLTIVLSVSTANANNHWWNKMKTPVGITALGIGAAAGVGAKLWHGANKILVEEFNPNLIALVTEGSIGEAATDAAILLLL